jgi:predicted nucleic acid-binding protein
MFVLDTNVLSAVMGRQPSPEVAIWVAAQPEERLFTTSVSQAEILAGIEILPEGRRRRALEAAAHAIFADVFDERILPFDTNAASAYADLFSIRRKAGRPSAPLDLMIASIARARREHGHAQHIRLRGLWPHLGQPMGCPMTTALRS